MQKRYIDHISYVPDFLIQYYEKKIEKDPGSRLFVPLSYVYLKEGKPKTAINILKKGIEIYPKYVSALTVLGAAYFDDGRLDKAEDVLRSAERLSPKNLLVHKRLYNIYRVQNDLRAAVSQLKKIYAIIPEDREVKRDIEKLSSMIRDREKKGREGGGEVQPSLKPKDRIEERKRGRSYKRNTRFSKGSMAGKKDNEKIITSLERWLVNIEKIQKNKSIAAQN